MKLLSLTCAICLVLGLLGFASVSAAAKCDGGRHVWTSAEAAAPDSIEGQLRSLGLGWTKVPGEICVGVYVQDILEGRLDQPVGRGAIGRVVSTSTAWNGKPLATVDFGRGFSVPIYFSELCHVAVSSEAKPQPQSCAAILPHQWTSAETALPGSVEWQLRSEKKRWTPTRGEICVGAYVHDILEGRLDQPVGRGAIGRVVSLSTAWNGKPLATVDFGRGFSVPIYFSELSTVAVAPCP